ncbi:MAG: hypothetical protein U1E39_09455 [Planctomycetota bacterium]
MDAFMFLTESAEIRPDALFNVIGGGATGVVVARDATHAQVAVRGVLVLRLDAHETGRHEVRVVMVDEDGGVHDSHGYVSLTRGGANCHPKTFDINGEFPVGTYQLRAVVDGSIVAAWPFRILRAGDPGTPAP